MIDPQIVELVRILAWPLVVAGGVFYWRHEIKTALKRIRRALGKKGPESAPCVASRQIVAMGRKLPAGSAPAAIRAADPMTARRAPAAPYAAARCLVDDGRILRLRIEARSALCLRIGDSHRSNNKDRGSQSHGDFTHQIHLLNGGVFWGT
jgi:hypothetical protein